MTRIRTLVAVGVAAAALLLSGCAAGNDLEYEQYAQGDAPFDWWDTVPWIEDEPVAYWVEVPDGVVLRVAAFDAPYCPQQPESFTSDGAGTFTVVFGDSDLGPNDMCPAMGGTVVTDFPVERDDAVEGAQLVVDGLVANVVRHEDGTTTTAPMTIPIQTNPEVTRPW